MKRTDLGGSQSIDRFVKQKIACLEQTQKDFRSIWTLMIREKDNLFCERVEGYSVVGTTYGQFAERTKILAGRLAAPLADVRGEMVGLYMDNCEEWLELFWALLMIGCRPLLMNTRMSDELMQDVLSTYGVHTVISDGKRFSCRTLTLEEVQALAQGPAPDENAWANEIVLMSSATSLKVKLCVYTGENIYYQVCDSARLIRANSALKKHYKGAIKQLVFLPLYHIFGLVAVFMWFAFFSRSFVFLRDYSADTILNTVRRCNVTHVFTVPLLWNRIYEETIKEVKRRDDGSYEKLMRGIALSEKLAAVPPIGALFDRIAFREVREGIFGDSISFLIAGGSSISGDVLRFFNAVGYHLANGYGMTELGITSVELSNRRKHLTDGSVGKPLYSVEYKITEESELLVRGRTMAQHVYSGGREIMRDGEGWFHTRDLAREEKGRYFILGRMDDLLIGADGENLNPDQLEELFRIPDAKRVCLAKDASSGSTVPTLVVEVPAYTDEETLRRIGKDAAAELARLHLDRSVGQVWLTGRPLVGEEEIKINRTLISRSLTEGTLPRAEASAAQDDMDPLMREVAQVFMAVLKREEPVGPDQHLMLDLGGSSLDYFTIVMELQNRYGIGFPQDGSGLATVREVCAYIRSRGAGS